MINNATIIKSFHFRISCYETRKTISILISTSKLIALTCILSTSFVLYNFPALTKTNFFILCKQIFVDKNLTNVANQRSKSGHWGKYKVFICTIYTQETYIKQTRKTYFPTILIFQGLYKKKLPFHLPFWTKMTQSPCSFVTFSNVRATPTVLQMSFAFLFLQKSLQNSYPTVWQKSFAFLLT
jgi:hypothetical protein